MADFIGEANIIPCEVTSVTDDVATIEIGGFVHSLPARGRSAGPAALAVRPTRLKLGAARGIEMQVRKATYVGSRMEYTLQSEFGEVFAVSEDVDTPLQPGTDVTVGLDAIGPVLLSADDLP